MTTHRIKASFAAACMALLMAMAFVAHAEGPETQPVATAASGVGGGSPPAADPMHDNVATVIFVALTQQFSGENIAVDIDDFAVQVADARMRIVTGHGTARVQGGTKSDTFGFSYRARYDIVDGRAGYPSISITGAGSGSERPVPNDSGLVAGIDERISSEISRDIGGKQVWLQLDDIESYEDGDRYLRINAKGLADLGAFGRSTVKIEAIYDRTQKSWLRMNYELGDSVDSGGPD